MTYSELRVDRRVDLGIRSNRVYRSLYMCATGDPERGFVYYGPFDTLEDAGIWREENSRDDVSCWVLALRDVTSRDEG